MRTYLPPAIPSFDQLRRTYPTLRALEAEAEAFEQNTDPHYCANEVWFGQRAYDAVYDGVYQKLPDCRRCGCFNPEALA